MITGTKVSFENQDGDSNNYEVSYDLGLKAINQTDQELNWYLVRTSQDIASLSSLNTCTLQSDKDTSTNTTKYYYNGCTVTGIFDKLGDGVLIGFGKINGSQNEATSLSSKNAEDTTDDSNLSDYFSGDTSKSIGLTNQKIYSNEDNGQKQFKSYYYYLIVEFPNNANQSQNGTANANFGKQISVTFDSITNIQSKVITE